MGLQQPCTATLSAFKSSIFNRSATHGPKTMPLTGASRLLGSSSPCYAFPVQFNFAPVCLSSKTNSSNLRYETTLPPHLLIDFLIRSVRLFAHTFVHTYFLLRRPADSIFTRPLLHLHCYLYTVFTSTTILAHKSVSLYTTSCLYYHLPPCCCMQTNQRHHSTRHTNSTQLRRHLHSKPHIRHPDILNIGQSTHMDLACKITNTTYLSACLHRLSLPKPGVVTSPQAHLP